MNKKHKNLKKKLIFFIPFFIVFILIVYTHTHIVVNNKYIYIIQYYINNEKFDIWQ